ncbi:ubiquitin-conjugating enzyme E2 27-like isoform X3 [Primulina huaijiensis]|uniref:ubiquitin-conjugating enzyme E2 27-like isoform X3 n=1 Tax=Primulina huaijiensis TaxID=1492673 RepID=UPI003CC776E2
MVDFARVQKELQECNRDFEVSGINVVPKSEVNLTHFLGTIPGPLGTPYEGGTFKIDIVLTDGYPFEPPKMKFITKVWHPNISSQSGAICLDILKDQWSPALTLKTALLSIQALLSTPEPDDPQDAVVARQVKKLVEMGFPETLVRSALESVGGDENLALEKLCSG